MHPIDRLAEVRQQIRELRAEAREIRRQLDAGEVGIKGDEYIGRMVTRLLLHRRIPATNKNGEFRLASD